MRLQEGIPWEGYLLAIYSALDIASRPPKRRKIRCVRFGTSFAKGTPPCFDHGNGRSDAASGGNIGRVMRGP